MRRTGRLASIVGATLLACLLFPACAAGAAETGGIPIHRLYNPYTGEHFYTESAHERDGLMDAGWRSEGIGWVAPSSGEPVNRLYNPYVAGGDHHYTTSFEEAKALERVGWIIEECGWGSGGSIQMYRQYNKYATTGTHNYTADQNERAALITAGWKDEGTAWMAQDTGDNTPASPTASQKRASARAAEMLQGEGHYSETGLATALEREGFSADDAAYAARYCGANWVWEGMQYVNPLYSDEGVSLVGARKALIEAGFTEQEADTVVKTIQTDWNYQARMRAEARLAERSYSRDELLKALVEEDGFTQEQTVSAVNVVATSDNR